MLKMDFKKIAVDKDISVEKCRKITEIELKLVCEDGLPVPEAQFKISFNNGRTESGFLDKNGQTTLHGIPEDDFVIEYFDYDEIRAKIFAARLNKSINEINTDAVFHILDLPEDELHAVSKFYRYYFGRILEFDVQEYFSNKAGGITARQILRTKGFIANFNQLQ